MWDPERSFVRARKCTAKHMPSKSGANALEMRGICDETDSKSHNFQVRVADMSRGIIQFSLCLEVAACVLQIGLTSWTKVGWEGKSPIFSASLLEREREREEKKKVEQGPFGVQIK